jgi:translation initiation factor IF-3
VTQGGHISTEPRINERIRVPEVRLVGPAGEQVGIVAINDALRLAQEADLDLVEVAPMARPPVAKLMDYGKFKYESALKARESRKNQAQTVIKEIKLRPKIDPHDYGTKKGHVERFLKQGDKVKVTIMFRGREQSRPELGFKLLQRLAGDIEELGFVESAPKQDGRNMIMVLGPHKRKTDAIAAAKAERASRSGAAERAAAASATSNSDRQEQTGSDQAGTAQQNGSQQASGRRPSAPAAVAPEAAEPAPAQAAEESAALAQAAEESAAPAASAPAASAPTAASPPAASAPAASAPAAPAPARSGTGQSGVQSGAPRPAAPRPTPGTARPTAPKPAAPKPAAPRTTPAPSARPGPSGSAAPKPSAPRGTTGARPAAPSAATPKPGPARRTGDSPVPSPRPVAAEQGASRDARRTSQGSTPEADTSES